MASLDYRLNPIYTIKECSPCGALYNKSCGCSKGGFVDKFVRDPNKTSDSSQRPPHNCLKCGNPVDGLYCRQCALLRKKLKEDPGENSSQSPPHIDHHCCFGHGDSLDDIFCQRCTCESCGNGAHYGYNCPPKVSIISNPEPCYNQNVDEFPQTLPSFHPTCYSGDENSFTYDSNLNFVDDSPNPPPQPPTYSYEFCGNDAYYGHDCPPQVPFIYNPEPCYNQDFNFPQNFQILTNSNHQFPVIHQPPQEMSIQDMEDMKQQYSDEMKSLINEIQIKDYRNEKIDIGFRRECEIKINELKENLNRMSIEINKKKELQHLEQVANLSTYPLRHFNSFCYDDDDDNDEEYTIAITPVLPTMEPDNSLSMGDEHLSAIPEKEESSVEDLVPIPSESEGISDNMCDVPFCENSTPLEASKDHYEILLDSNDDYSSSDDDSLYSKDIDYVDASPPDFELVSLEVVEIVILEVGGIDTDILLTIKDDILREKLLNVNLLIAKIEALKDNPTPSPDFVTKSSSTSLNFFLEETNTFDNSLPESETFCFNLEEISSGSPTSYTDLSLPDYEAFFCDSELDSGDFTMDVVEDIFDNPTREPRVHIFDPGIFREVQSKRFLSLNEFSISFIRDPLSPVFDSLLPFSSENKDKGFNPGILASNEEKSPHLLSHPPKIIFDFYDCPDYKASRARSFVHRSLKLLILSFILGIQYPNLID
ncbi:hypothetical protein Tco_0747537 [Tanacetum coccineum]|uniref:Uncharacterized protein n=1 Tax=Tanacetum coccineum TaxID=301880 RepID=A0ABQ4YU64_9ASTR